MEFREITLENISTITDLEVSKEQEHLITDNCYSIVQALLAKNAWCKAIYNKNTAIGFFSIIDNEKNIKYIWKYMIAKEYQGIGFGKKAFHQLIHLLYKKGAIRIELRVSGDEGNAEELYRKCGFVKTGDYRDGEFLMIHKGKE
jgi:diamine N-acetyltransferase